MAKKILCATVLILALVCALISCGHEHEWGEWKVVKEPTLYEEGLEERACSCGEKETNVLDKLPPITTVSAKEWKEALKISKYNSFTVTGSEKGSEDGQDFDFDLTIKYSDGDISFTGTGNFYRGDESLSGYAKNATESEIFDLFLSLEALNNQIDDMAELDDFGYSEAIYSKEKGIYIMPDADNANKSYSFRFENGKLAKVIFEDLNESEPCYGEYSISNINSTEKDEISLSEIKGKLAALADEIPSSAEIKRYASGSYGDNNPVNPSVFKEKLKNLDIAKVEEACFAKGLILLSAEDSSGDKITVNILNTEDDLNISCSIDGYIYRGR